MRWGRDGNWLKKGKEIQKYEENGVGQKKVDEQGADCMKKKKVNRWQNDERFKDREEKQKFRQSNVTNEEFEGGSEYRN